MEPRSSPDSGFPETKLRSWAGLVYRTLVLGVPLERELSAGALEEFARAYPMLMLEQNRLLPGARAR